MTLLPIKRTKLQSLGHDRRLHDRWEFKKFFDQSEVFRLSECVIFRIPNDFGHFRLGITLKARGGAIGRNSVRRKIREAFRRLEPILGSYDYNVVVPATKKLRYPYPNKLSEALQNDFQKVLKNSL